MSKIISACGLDCFSCECYEATQTGDLEHKKKIAAKWSKEYQVSLTIDDINCDSCMMGDSHFSWCHKCPIRSCAIEKNYENCAECDHFPCQKGEFIFQVFPQAKKNIESLRS